MPRKRGTRLSEGSLRTTDWAAQEYRRLMGDEAADRQELEYKLSHAKCTCAKRTIKVSGGFLTIHHEGCIKFKPWMADYAARLREA